LIISSLAKFYQTIKLDLMRAVFVSSVRLSDFGLPLPQRLHRRRL